MKKLIYLIALLVISNCLFAQTKKVYLTKSGNYTANSSKGVAYLLVSRLGEDSAYLATKFDMNNNMIFKGTFKDEELTTPIGKYVIYKTTPSAGDNKTVFSTSITYEAMAGYFNNGKRTGMWYEYSPKGEVIAKYNYDNNVLNGSYEIFNPANGYHGIGTTVNGELQGDFKIYNSDNLLAEELTYNKGKINQKVAYLKDAEENNDLQWHIEQNLRKYIPVLYDSEVTLTYTIDKKGNITDPHIVNGFNQQINQTILAAVTNYNGYKPALYNNVPVDQKTTLTFHIFASNSDRHNPIITKPSIYNDPAVLSNPALAYQGKF